MRRTVSEDIARSGVASLWALQCFLEPDVLIARVIRDDIDNDLNSIGLERGHHLVKVGKGTDARVDIAVVGDIVW